MSLLKRKELAKSKSELGNKINHVHDMQSHNIKSASRQAKSHFQRYSNQ